MGRSARKLQAYKEDGGIFDFTEQNKVEKSIWGRIHKKRFHLAEQAPICQGQIQGDFVYLSNTPTTSQLLSGTYNYPPGYDHATQELLQECELICHIVPKDAVSSTFKTKSCQYRWVRSKEKTSSSESDIYFGHYIEGEQSSIISLYHALKTTIALKRGFALDLW